MYRPSRPLALALAHTLALAVPAHAAGRLEPDAVVGTRLADGTGYPSLVRLAHQPDDSQDGALLLVFEQYGLAGIPLWRSDDDGGHWHFEQDLVDQRPHRDALHWQLRWQPNLIETWRSSGPLAKGTLLLAANATGDAADGRLVAEDLQLYASTDQGRHWRYRGSIITGGGNPSDQDNRGVWEPNLHVLDDGRLVAYYSSEQHKAEGYNQLLAHKVSTDGGVSWGAEHVDVAIPGGVERPGMAVVTRLSDRRYVMTYENIDGPKNGQVYLKTSADGMDFGDPHHHGTPVTTAAGGWPAACPTVFWLPLGEDQAHGVLAILAERASGGADEGGRSLWWNTDDGRGPWWRSPAPVQKRTGNIHAGWTQALLVRKDGALLHVSSSSDAQAPADEARNVMLYASGNVDFDRYEAEDAVRHAAVQIGDPAASLGGKARVASMPEGALDFPVHLLRNGPRELSVRWRDLGFATEPTVSVDGQSVALAGRPDRDGWRIAHATVTLASGDHLVVVHGGVHAMDVDYLQLAPAQGH